MKGPPADRNGCGTIYVSPPPPAVPAEMFALCVRPQVDLKV